MDNSPICGHKVSRRGQAGDFGPDLIMGGPEGKIAVQAAYSGMAHYGFVEGWEVINYQFTKAAQAQAKSCGVALVDRDMLMDMIERSGKKGSG